jgi:hypothetical protein
MFLGLECDDDIGGVLFLLWRCAGLRAAASGEKRAGRIEVRRYA